MQFYSMSGLNGERTPLVRRIALTKPTSWPASAMVAFLGLGLALVVAGALAITFGVLYGNNQTPNCATFAPLSQIAKAVANYPLVGKLELEWNDEFSTPNVNRKLWETVSQTGTGTGNNEEQIYVSLDEANGYKHTFIRNGKLVLRAESVPPTFVSTKSYPVNSSKVYSRQLCHYGYTEVRAKAPSQDYVWPALWFFPITAGTAASEETPGRVSPYNNWPQTGELDLLEVFGLADASSLWTGTEGYLHFCESAKR